MSLAGGYRLLQIQCSNVEAVSWGFHISRIKRFINQGIKKFLGENIKWAGTIGRGVPTTALRCYPIALLALPLVENRVLVN